MLLESNSPACSQATFELENINLLSKPKVNPKNGVAYNKKMCSHVPTQVP